MHINVQVNSFRHFRLRKKALAETVKAVSPEHCFDIRNGIKRNVIF